MADIDRQFEGPLAFPAQIEAERKALRIFDAPELVAARQALAAELREDPVAVFPDGLSTLEPSLDQWTMTLILWELNGDTARPEILWSVEDTPRTWFGHVMPGAAVAGDNPDHIYRNAFLDGASTYEIDGRLPGNGPSQFSIEIYRGSPGSTPMTAQVPGRPDLGNQVSLIMASGMEIGPDGRFTLTIGAGRGPVPANHLELEEGPMTLAARDVLSDWSQEPVTLSIRRTSGPEPAAPLTEEGVTAKVVEGLPGFVRFWSRFNHKWLGGLSDNQVVGPVPRDGGWGYLAAGRFNLSEDEALLIETNDEGAPYTGFEVVNLWMVMHAEATAGTVSLNSAQAARNPDGSITYLLARRDPGLANWIDTAGLGHGIFILRWQAVPPGADPARMLTGCRLLRFDEIDRAVAPDVPRMDAEQRRAQVAQRRQDFERRLGTPA